MCPLPCGFILDEMERERTRGRTVGCMCGHRVEGTDDADLRRLVRMHVDRVHPEFAYTGEQIRRWVASAARDAVPDGPFSARGRWKEEMTEERGTGSSVRRGRGSRGKERP